MCLWVLQADLRLQFMCQTQMNSVLNTDSKWRPKLQKTIAFNHYTVRDTRVCVCACVRMLGVFIFEQIGCSNTAHFAFKTPHVPWTRKWMLQPRWGVCTFHIMLFTLSDLTKHWFYALSNKAKCTWTVQSEQYWWGGGVGISFWGHDQRTPSWLDPPDWMEPGVAVLTCERISPLHVMIMGYSNCWVRTLVWFGVNIRKQW